MRFHTILTSVFVGVGAFFLAAICLTFNMTFVAIALYCVSAGCFWYFILLFFKKSTLISDLEILDSSIVMSTEMGADECILGIENGKGFVFACFINEDPVVLHECSSNTIISIMHIYATEYSINDSWDMLQEKQPPGIISATGKIFDFNNTKALSISFRYCTGEQNITTSKDGVLYEYKNRDL